MGAGYNRCRGRVKAFIMMNSWVCSGVQRCKNKTAPGALYDTTCFEIRLYGKNFWLCHVSDLCAPYTVETHRTEFSLKLF